MRKIFPLLYGTCISMLMLLITQSTYSQTLAFPTAEGFGRFATGARGVPQPQVYRVTNLNDDGPGSFRDAVSQPGRFVVFSIGGIINLKTVVAVARNTTIAAQTAPGDGIVLFNKTVSFSNSSNTISRYLRIRLGATGNDGKDASGIASGNNIILDHMSFTWGLDEVFSINWDSKGPAPDNITLQNCIIGQGLHRHNHSAGGLIQTPDGGRVSLLKNLYISNKTRNPKVKGVNEFVNNVVYNWGNGNRLGDQMNYGWSGDAYIMGGESQGVSEVNIINNYFVSGPNTPPSKTTPFSRGSGNFFLYGAGNYFDNNQNGQLDGTLVPTNDSGYPGIIGDSFKPQPFAYPAANPALTASQAYEYIIDQAGAVYPRRDQVDQLMIDEVKSRGTTGLYVYRETDLPLGNGGLGNVFSGPAAPDKDQDGMSDSWENENGLNMNDPTDAVAPSTTHSGYLNIEVYINGIIAIAPPDYIRPPSGLTWSATSVETPVPSSTVILNWTDNSSNEQNFLLERSTDGDSFTVIKTLEANSTEYTDDHQLSPNTTYYYRVKAIHATDQSAYSAVASVKTPPIPAAPGLPQVGYPENHHQYVVLSNGALTLKWTGSSNSEKFSVYFGSNPLALEKKAELAYSEAPSLEITGLVEGSTYYWRIDAANYKGTTTGEIWSFRTVKDIPKGIIGYWSFDDPEGIQVTDSTSYLNHGILGLDDDNTSIRTAGKYKTALDFSTADLSSYVVSVPHADQLYLSQSSFTISFWMKADATMLPQDNSNSAYLLCKGSITKNTLTKATGKRFDIEFKNKQFRFAIDDDNDANGGGKDELQATATSFFNNDWVYVTVIRDVENKKLKLYQNGILFKEVAIAKANAGIGEVSALIIGNIGEYEFLSNANQSAPYRGMLDELKMYNYALTESEIMNNYHTDPTPMQAFNPFPATTAVIERTDRAAVSWTAGIKTSSFEVFLGTSADNMVLQKAIAVDSPTFVFNNLGINTLYFWRVDALGEGGKTTGKVWTFHTAKFPRGLSGHWQLDERTGEMAADSSSYANHGTLQNFSTYEWSADARFQGSLKFSNPLANGAITVPDAEQIRFDKSSFSLSMWVKIATTTSPDCYLIQKGTFEANTGKWYGLQLRNNVLSFAIDDGNAKTNVDIPINKAPFLLLAQSWKHIVAVRDAGSNVLKLYIDGQLAGSKTSGGTSGTIGQQKPLLIGNSTENKPYKEALDDLRIYNYALSDAEITDLFNGRALVKKVINVSPGDSTANLSAEKIELSWTGDAEQYNLYLGKSGDSLSVVQEGIRTESYSIENLSYLTRYFWRVDAVNDGETATGDTWSFHTQAIPTPVIDSGQVFAVRELSPAGTEIGTLTAHDPLGNTLRNWRIINNPDPDKNGIPAFRIDSANGKLSINDPNDFNYFKTAAMELTAMVDNRLLTSIAEEVLINVLFVNQSPTLDDIPTQVLCQRAGVRVMKLSGISAGRETSQTVNISLGDPAGQFDLLNADLKNKGTAQIRYRLKSEVAGAASFTVIITDDGGTENGGNNSLHKTVNLQVNASPELMITANRPLEIQLGQSITLTATGGSNYKWEREKGSFGSAPGSSITVRPIHTTTYRVSSNLESGCVSEKEVTVIVNCILKAKNILTPNGDGNNDLFTIDNLEQFPDNELKVVDRFGKLLYRKKGYTNDWNGFYNGAPLPEGTYYFTLKYSQSEKPLTGFLTLIRSR